MKSSGLKTIRVIIAAVVAAAALFCVVAASGQTALEGDVVRLHVLANSDGAADQAAKLLVRDALLAGYGDVLAAARDADEAARIVKEQLPGICGLARQTLLDAGVDYPVTGSFTRSRFPSKQYGAATLPAGEYISLKLVIGEGAGQNWWCVLFPPLCVGAERDLDKILDQSGMTDGEKELVLGEGAAVELRLRFLDLIAQWTGRKKPAGIVLK